MKSQSFKELLSFFKELKENNNKVWFEPKKPEYKKLATEFKEFMDGILMDIVSYDDEILEGMKDDRKVSKVFRIYIDARFSKDKTPLKVHMGGVISSKKAEEGNPCYYLHIEPGGKSFVAGGVYLPPSDQLKALREKIDNDPEVFARLEQAPDFAEFFPRGLDQDYVLKTSPRDYPKDHVAIEYLRLKSFTVHKSMSDKEVLSSGLQENVEKAFRQIYKLNELLRVG